MSNEKLSALLETSSGLTEEFKAAAQGIFEEAVQAKVAELAEIKEAELKAEYNEKLTEQVAAVQEQVDSLVEAQLEEEYASISDHLDNYLKYVVEEFVTTHEEELVEAQKRFISADFMSKIAETFEEYNIASPEKAHALEEAKAAHEAELEEAYSTISRLVEEREAVTQELEEAKRDMDLLKLVEEKDLSDLQVRKLYGIMEGFESMDKIAFLEKASSVCDTILSETKSEKTQVQTFITESVPTAEESKKVVQEQVHSDVDAVLRALTQGMRH